MWWGRGRREERAVAAARTRELERERARQRRVEARLHRWLAVWAVLLAVFLAVLPVAAYRDSAGGALAASVVICGYALVTCRMGWLVGEDDARRPAGPAPADPPATAGEKVQGVVGVTLVLVMFALFPLAAAKQHLPGRGGGGGLQLDFGDAAPAVLEAARALGWVATALVVVGAPLAAWVGARRA